MASGEITNFDDLMALLERNPEYRERLRRSILDEEFRRLPDNVRAQADRFDVLTGEVRALTARVDSLTERVDSLTEEVRAQTRRIDTLSEQMTSLIHTVEAHTSILDGILKTLEQHGRTLEQQGEMLAQHGRTLEQHGEMLVQHGEMLVQHGEMLAQHGRTLEQHTRMLERHDRQLSRLIGNEAEQRFRDHAPGYFGRMMRRIRVTDRFELADLIDDAVDDGTLTEGDQRSLLALDLALRGIDRQTRQPMHLAVEVSSSIGERDIMRAADRAALLGKMTGEPVRAAVGGYYISSAFRQLAEDKDVAVTIVTPPDAGEPEEFDEAPPVQDEPVEA